MWEKDININEVREIRSRTTVYFGVGAIAKIGDICKDLKARGLDKLIVMTGRGAYKKTGAWDHVTKAFADNGITYVHYDKVTPNPNTHHVNEAAKMAADFGAKAMLAIGGGSAIDAGKSVAILMKNPGKTAEELYEFTFTPTEAAPIIAINLTHGTGSEANRFAVVSIEEKNFKPAIAYDCIYPLYSIDDPALMTGLSEDQTRYVSIDAVNHVVEASTTLVASPYAIDLAISVVKLVHEYLPVALKDPSNLEARYFLAYAALIAGISFDNGLLHYTHALEHPLSGVNPNLTHGLGLAMLLPAVLKNIYAARPATLADVLAPIVPGLKGDAAEAQAVAKGVEKWLFSVGSTHKLEDEGFKASDVDKLVDLAFNTPSLGGLLGIAPTKADKEAVRAIYTESLTPYNK
ncbi:iron-containing alcohol dehydrogenase [Candidatus Avelusimicrobium aviculae]|uniref:iron-containing alcohol dehydrogenase n=1 Tax=Candidatus Avelusimicrobium aviculae TaxID=3416206 RepID=UPI003D123006